MVATFLNLIHPILKESLQCVRMHTHTYIRTEIFQFTTGTKLTLHPIIIITIILLLLIFYDISIGKSEDKTTLRIGGAAVCAREYLRLAVNKKSVIRQTCMKDLNNFILFYCFAKM
jgi:hypothetical protein